MLTIPLVATALFLRDKIPQNSYARASLCIAILSSAVHAFLQPPDSSAFVKYTNAFLSGAYVIRAVELLLVHNLAQLKRLDRVVSSEASSPTYSWKPIPAALGFARFFWICDLLINPRAIGWSYGPARYLPPLRDQLQSQPRAQSNDDSEKDSFHPAKHLICVADENHWVFAKRQLLRILYAYVVLDSYQATFGRNYPALCESFATAVNAVFGTHISQDTSDFLVKKYLFGPICWVVSYAFVDGAHALIGLLGVGVLSRLFNVHREPWMYPPLFGSVRYLFTFRLRDIWGKLWHDLCRRPFLAVSLALLPKHSSQRTKTLIVLWLSFSLSGIIHASGAYAVSQDVRAAGMMMVFFAVLPACVALQQVLSAEVLPRVLPGKVFSGWVIWVLDAGFVWVWASWTCPWFIEFSMLPQAMASIPIPGSFWGWLGGRGIFG